MMRERELEKERERKKERAHDLVTHAQEREHDRELIEGMETRDRMQASVGKRERELHEVCGSSVWRIESQKAVAKFVFHFLFIFENWDFEVGHRISETGKTDMGHPFWPTARFSVWFWKSECPWSWRCQDLLQYVMLHVNVRVDLKCLSRARQ